MTKQAQYIIGIDLGTTNCTMAYASLADEQHEIKQFSIPQITASGVQGEQLSLPSFLYFALKAEQDAKTAGMEWDPSCGHCVGVYARERSAEVPTRVIASAKSWLCHTGINRRDKILPLGGEEEFEKMSPLQVCAELLRHLKQAWESKMSDAPMKAQQVLITVPASFDPSARQLVQEAAALAEYPDIILLEEPQAAFYAWLHTHADNWRKILKVGDTVLVADIGGGTTDFSLIAVEEEQGNLTLRRVAVGAHLLLGGDNIDLSLAYLAKSKLEEQGHVVDDWQFQSLIHACRRAKETLMGNEAPKSYDVTIMGRGSKLIGGSLKATLTLVEVRSLLVDGFMPTVTPEERSNVEKRAGIQQVGLPYAQDARITSQLAKFLSMTGEADSVAMDHFVVPSAILYNGGTMKSTVFQERMHDVLNAWAKKLKKDPVKALEGAEYDFAVSRGAVSYGIARLGKAIRIRSGTGRSYYIGVEEAVPAVPGLAAPLKAICVVPFGMEEGTEAELPNQEFALTLGETAEFRFFSRSTPQLPSGADPAMGTSVKSWKVDLTELHPLETRLERGDDDGKTVRVKLKSRVTELGVLELWCASQDGRQWKLEFDLRDPSEAR